MTGRVTFDDSGQLDEVCSSKGAHLERLGDTQWFLVFDHADGSKSAFWFSSRNLHKQKGEKRA